MDSHRPGVTSFVHIGLVVEDLDGSDIFEVVRFQSPSAGAQEPAPAANRPGFRHVAFKVDDVRGVVDRVREAGWEPSGRSSTTRASGVRSRAMRRMTDEEWHAFVMEGTRTAKVATARKDGRPHVVPVWFVLDGEDVVFTTGASSVKGQALLRDPYACLCVDDQAPPFSFVMVEGSVELSTDLDELRRVATRIGRRYMGAERAEEFGARNAVEGELLVRLRPTHVLAEADLAD